LAACQDHRGVDGLSGARIIPTTDGASFAGENTYPIYAVVMGEKAEVNRKAIIIS
jgi:hypothetical protein